jgi:hypothetical protein
MMATQKVKKKSLEEKIKKKQFLLSVWTMNIIVKNCHVLKKMQIIVEDIRLYFEEVNTLLFLICTETFIVLNKWFQFAYCIFLVSANYML